MIGWLNNRQQAVDDAKAATSHTNVSVYNYAEANRVRDAMLNGTNNNQRVINMVVPYVTNLDYLSYSSYDAENLDASDLYTTLNYMQSHLPTAKAGLAPGQRMWIGEYGWGGDTPAAQEPLARSYIQRLLNWQGTSGALQFILFWEIYDNQTSNGTNYCLIDSTGTKFPCYFLHQRFINNARLLTAQFYETNGYLPSDAQFSALVAPMLNAPLPPPVNLTVSNLNATLLDPTSASVSGSLTQGVYGDEEASVWLYWGLQDGGANAAAWQDVEFLGVNTNFNPKTFTVPLFNLLAQTNYYFRFFASNAAASAWAPRTAQFSTVTLNPTNFGSSLQITFSGYNRPETLVNFPVLVNLSTNLPGFSYQQFAQPDGGDLRFTDSSGLLPIPFEIDEWNTNGASSVWVSVPSLSTSNDSIWAYWGNAGPIDPPPPASNVWLNAGYQIVYHLKETHFPYVDSTGQHPAGNGVAPAQTAGVVGHGQSFNGSSDYLTPGAVTLNNKFTTYAWVNLSPNVMNIQTIWCNQQGAYGNNGFAEFVNSYNTSDRGILIATGNVPGGSSTGTQSEFDTGNFPQGSWHLFTVTFDQPNSLYNMFLDGVSLSSGPINGAFGLTNQLNLGAFLNPTFYWTGDMDEARIQSGLASSNWIWASWQTVAANAGLESYSAVTQQPPLLSIGANGGGLTLSWPGSGVGFALYSATNLAPPIVWTPATNPPALSNGQWQITIPAGSDTARFYRLQAQ